MSGFGGNLCCTWKYYNWGEERIKSCFDNYPPHREMNDMFRMVWQREKTKEQLSTPPACLKELKIEKQINSQAFPTVRICLCT